jgi:hypothetical protein
MARDMGITPASGELNDICAAAKEFEASLNLDFYLRLQRFDHHCSTIANKKEGFDG